MRRRVLETILKNNVPPLDPCCFSSTHLWRHSWCTHFAVPRQRHGDTQQAEKSSSSVAKQTQQCFPGKLVRVGIVFDNDVRVPFDDDGGGGGCGVDGELELFARVDTGIFEVWLNGNEDESKLSIDAFVKLK